MDISHMREFLVLAEELNYTTAAQSLYISQPTLTRHINALEEDLGARLLNRTRHVVKLTPSGEAAVKAFKSIVQLSDELVGEIGEIVQETTIGLHLGMVYYGPSAYYGYPLLKAFAIAHPEVHVSTITSLTGPIYENLQRGVIDLGITITSPYFDNPAMVKTTIAQIPLYAVMLPTHRLAERESISPEELSHEKLILNRIPPDNRNHVFTMFENHGLELKEYEYTQHIDTLLLSMAQTNGIFMGTMLLTAIPQHALAFVPIEADDFVLDVSFLHMKGNDNPNIGKMIECIDGIRIPRM